jgi:uncharacterized caspase-like protein
LIERVLTAINFSVTKRSDLNGNDMKTALAEFCNTLSETDAAIVYYSGHGYQFNEQSRLVPVD